MKWRALLNTSPARAAVLGVRIVVAIILLVIAMAVVIVSGAVFTSFLVEFGNYIRLLKGW